MKEPVFLKLEDILHIHEREISVSGGEPNIREPNGVAACVDAPKASFGGDYLLDIFGMAATYISCITLRHPFVDGNKRTALASALTFLFINGYDVKEEYDVELADIVVSFIIKEISKEDLTEILKNKSEKRE